MKEIEIIEKRKPKEKHFLREDGTMKAIVYSEYKSLRKKKKRKLAKKNERKKKKKQAEKAKSPLNQKARAKSQ